MVVVTPMRSIRISEQLWLAVKQRAEMEQVTVSDLIRDALLQRLERNHS